MRIQEYLRLGSLQTKVEEAKAKEARAVAATAPNKSSALASSKLEGLPDEEAKAVARAAAQDAVAEFLTE